MHSYSKIYRYILDKIKSGELKDGDTVPKEMDLSKQFSVSRPTVRQALGMLVSDGYVSRVRGKGSFVTKPKVMQGYTRFIESYNDEMKKKGLVPMTKVLEVSVKYPEEHIRKQLELDENEKVVQLKRLRYIVENNSPKPMILTTVYFPLSLMPQFFEYDFETASFYDALGKNGVKISRVTRLMEVKLMTRKMAQMFSLADSAPCHYISSVGYDEGGKPCEYSENYYPADRNTFTVVIEN